jgi:FkbM family methyltransferase
MDNQNSPAIAVADAMRQLHQGLLVPDYESLLSKGYRRFLGPGRVVFDIGCHAGQHFDQFLELVGPSGRVIGFEPIPKLATALAEKYRSYSNAEIRTVALAEKPGRSEFLVLPHAIGMSGFKQRADSADQSAEKIIVRIDTLDQQAAGLTGLDYIKIDIEGSEINCLRGARQTVAQHRPWISVEYGRPTYSLFGNTAMSLFEWATENGYVPSDLFGNLILTSEEWIAICDRSYWDYFLVPKERQQPWVSLF